MRILNLKFLRVVIFTLLFFVGGFFLNIAQGEASDTVQSLGVSYSLSTIMSTTNSDGSITTKRLVGCAPQSGDLYDINTGRPCTNNNTQTLLPACKIGSGDIFDINTGIRCDSYIKPVLIGCGINSMHLYDINTGNRCMNNTSILINEKTQTTTPVVSKINPVKQVEEVVAITNKPIEEIQKEEDGELSGREVLMNNLSASTSKVGQVFKGPMILWIILILIAILLGGGYGIYSMLKKDKDADEIKKVEPIVPTNKAPVQETLPINNPVKENPIKQNTPIVNTPNTQSTQPISSPAPVINPTGPNTSK